MGVAYAICIECEYLKDTKKGGCKFPADRTNPLCRKRTCSGFEKRTSIMEEVAREVVRLHKFLR